MGNISELPDDLLLLILSFVPTKDVVPTSLLSRRWKSLWTKVAGLKFYFDMPNNYHNKIAVARFIRGSLLSHQQPHALETLHLDLSPYSLDIDIRPWIRTHFLCNLHELRVEAGTCSCISLPSALFTCKKLVVLRLEGKIDVSLPSPVCLPSLKTLKFSCLKLFNYESIPRILSKCHLLCDLTLDHEICCAMLNMHIIMPTLQRLSVLTVSSWTASPFVLNYYFWNLAISTPSLKYFNIIDLRPTVRVSIRPPSNLEDASIFRRIVHLELSTCVHLFEELLVYFLKASINLSVLKIKNYSRAPLNYWNPPSSVPTCLISSLETLEWRGYTGIGGENKELVSYLLNHAQCLKTGKFFLKRSKHVEETQQKLASVPRGSTTSELVFNLVPRVLAAPHPQ